MAAQQQNVHARVRGLRIDPERFDSELTTKGLTGAELAQRADVSPSVISKLRRGQRVDRETLLKVVAALDGVPVIAGLERLTRRSSGG